MLPITNQITAKMRSHRTRLVIKQRQQKWWTLAGSLTALRLGKQCRPERVQFRRIHETAENKFRRLGRTQPENKIEFVLHKARHRSLVAIFSQTLKIGSRRKNRGPIRGAGCDHLLRLHIPIEQLRFALRNHCALLSTTLKLRWLFFVRRCLLALTRLRVCLLLEFTDLHSTTLTHLIAFLLRFTSHAPRVLQCVICLGFYFVVTERNRIFRLIFLHVHRRFGSCCFCQRRWHC